MRKHQLMDPAFPDLVGAWAATDRTGVARCRGPSVNDNETESMTELSDPFFELLARTEIAETRLW